MISTLTARQFQETRLRDELNSGALILGMDGWTFLDSSKTWVVSGWVGMSQVRGSTARMIDLQSSSRHYFQRPDADYIHMDSSATGMTGYAARFCLNKQKGNVFVNSAFGVIDPKFDTNDMGFMWRTDVINGHIGGGYQWTKPNKFRRNMEVGIAAFRSYDFGGNITWEGLFHFGYLQLLNYYDFNWDFAYNPQTINNTRTRGGPLTISPPSWQFEIRGETDNRKAWVFQLEASTYQASYSKSTEVSAEVKWKPATNINLSFKPSLMHDYTKAQWIDVFDDPNATATFGHHYVFGRLDLTELSASIRLDWAFTPKLSLQLYLQPLISAGNFSDFKELARPKSFDFNHFGEGESKIVFENNDYTVYPYGFNTPYHLGFDNPDFNFKSLRGNAVLRWEFLPGSTLYFVWTQSRSDNEEMGNFRFNHSVDRLLNTRANNILMVKLAYWRGL